MSIKKSALENNKVFHNIMEKEALIEYAYNDKYFYRDTPQHEKVVSKKHDSYLEAIVAAIYKDGGWDKVANWFDNWLFPRLEAYKSK